MGSAGVRPSRDSTWTRNARHHHDDSIDFAPRRARGSEGPVDSMIMKAITVASHETPCQWQRPGRAAAALTASHGHGDSATQPDSEAGIKLPDSPADSE